MFFLTGTKNFLRNSHLLSINDAWDNLHRGLDYSTGEWGGGGEGQFDNCYRYDGIFSKVVQILCVYV